MSFEGKFAQVPSPGLLISLLSGRCFVEFRKLFGLLKTVSLRAVLPFPAWLYLWAASQAWAVVRRWSTAESEASECPLEARGGTDDPEGRSLPGDRQVARDCRCPGSASWTLVPWPRQGWDPESLERLTAACGVHGRIQRVHPRSMSRQVWGRDGVMAGGAHVCSCYRTGSPRASVALRVTVHTCVEMEMLCGKETLLRPLHVCCRTSRWPLCFSFFFPAYHAIFCFQCLFLTN